MWVHRCERSDSRAFRSRPIRISKRVRLLVSCAQRVCSNRRGNLYVVWYSVRVTMKLYMRKMFLVRSAGQAGPNKLSNAALSCIIVQQQSKQSASAGPHFRTVLPASFWLLDENRCALPCGVIDSVCVVACVSPIFVLFMKRLLIFAF